jgi:hypothetical protein
VRQEGKEVGSAADVSLSDGGLGDVVTASRDARPYARDVAFDAIEPHVPHKNLATGAERGEQEGGDGASTQCRLERIGQSLFDCAY